MLSLSTEDVADLLDISTQSVRNMIGESLEVVKESKNFRYTLESVRKLIRTRFHQGYLINPYKIAAVRLSKSVEEIRYEYEYLPAATTGDMLDIDAWKDVMRSSRNSINMANNEWLGL